MKAAALEQYLASEQARTATQISLVAAVANAYLALAGDRENLRLSQVTRDAQQASYELIRQSRDAGIASDLDLSQARSQVEVAQVEIERFAGQVALDENALNLLVGVPVAASLLADDLNKVAAMEDVEPGLPSDVLLRRPDILQAEHELKAASANIGGARAAFFLPNVRYEIRDATSFDLSDRFDLVTAFDAIHDQAHPDVVLRNIATVLHPNGTFLMQDIAGSSHLEKNLAHPLASLLYTVSCMHCMTVSLAQGGVGLGTIWGEELAAQMLREAGFRRVRIERLAHDFFELLLRRPPLTWRGTQQERSFQCLCSSFSGTRRWH